MDCPRCGYALSAFDAECPRCRRLAGRARSQASAYVADARAQGFGDDIIRHQLLQAGWDPTGADEVLRHAEAPEPAHEATAVTAPTQTRPTGALESPGDAAHSPKRREPRGATDAGGGGGKTSARRRLTALVAVLAAAGGAVALWFYIACIPVQTGTVTTCPVCGVTLVNEVSTLRVPRWLRDQYRVDRREMLCGRCADETIAVTTTTTVYCPDCRRTLRSFTVTGEVKRGEQAVWEADHKWQEEKCNRCRHGELMAQGRKLYAQRRYGEAKAAFEAAKKTYPENSDPDRWLAGIADEKATEEAGPVVPEYKIAGTVDSMIDFDGLTVFLSVGPPDTPFLGGYGPWGHGSADRAKLRSIVNDVVDKYRARHNKIRVWMVTADDIVIFEWSETGGVTRAK